MDASSPDLVLKELKRIKWLLVLIVLALLTVPVSFVYVSWELASLLQEKPVEEEEGAVETTAEDLLRQRQFDGLGQFIDRRETDDPPHDGPATPSSLRIGEGISR
jgi:hypothetical protein